VWAEPLEGWNCEAALLSRHAEHLLCGLTRKRYSTCLGFFTCTRTDRLAQTPAPLPCGAYAGSNPRNAHGGTEHARSRARRHAAKQLRTHAHRRGSPGR